jgi:pilus assembly protein CpaB
MFKKRGLMLVVLSVLLGIGAAWFANGWVQGRLAPINAVEAGAVPVMAAAINIPYGTKIESRHVKALQIPPEAIPGGAIRDIADVEGKIATQEVLAGEMLMESRFVEHGGGSTLAALVAPNMRAITLRVDDVIGVAGFLLPGNYVDILSSRKKSGSREYTTETILKNIKVLAVDQTARTDENDPVVVRAVTLELEPKQSELLVKHKNEGRIQLTLRNPLDDLVEEEKKPVAKKVARRTYTAPTTTDVQIIRGTKVATKKAKK